MASYETQINNLEKEQSDAHYTFFGALKLIGGLAFFGLAVILTPSMFPDEEARYIYTR